MEKLHILEHPLLRHKLTLLRDVKTGASEFRALVSEIAGLMCYESTRDLPLEERIVETPITKTMGYLIAGRKLAIVPILRAGLGMVDGVLAMMPEVKIGHIGLYRDEESLEPVEYYCKLPTDIDQREVILLDPMLATGGSALAAVKLLQQKGVRKIKLMHILATPEGVALIHKECPDVDIFCASLEEGLNEQGYIVPGLGDAGDRIFGTK